MQSPLLQELALYVGQELVFSDGEECLSKIGNISIGGKQIERLCHHYGQLLEERPAEEEAVGQPPSEPHYVMMDGSMVLCRKDGWSEMKLARIFARSSVLTCGKSRKWVRQSRYLAHLGSSADFTEKLDAMISGCKNKVFIADGARWIWKYIEESHPQSEQILDYYHALEYLHSFAGDQLPSEQERRAFASQCVALLDEDGVAEVIGKVKAIQPCGKARESHAKLISYYTNNAERMMYKTFREKGYAIGSGAMESANRTVIQERVKRSGQRWTREGVQQVVNLRVAHQSNQWSIVTNLIRNAA